VDVAGLNETRECSWKDNKMEQSPKMDDAREKPVLAAKEGICNGLSLTLFPCVARTRLFCSAQRTQALADAAPQALVQLQRQTRSFGRA